MPPSTETVNLGDSSLYGSTDRRPQHVVDVPGAAGQYDEAIDAERDGLADLLVGQTSRCLRNRLDRRP